MTASRAAARLVRRRVVHQPLSHLASPATVLAARSAPPIAVAFTRAISTSTPSGSRMNISKGRRLHRTPATQRTHDHAPPPQQVPEPHQNLEPQTTALAPTDPSLSTPVTVPDEPHGILSSSTKLTFEGARTLLSQPALVVTREIEMMNIFLGFEQANKYSLHSPDGSLLGYLAEEETGLLGGSLQRQLLRTHRPFKATVMDTSGCPVLVIRRPFTWINSTASIYAVRGSYSAGDGAPKEDDLELVGEVQQKWHIYKRRYELFLKRGEGRFEQFAQIDSGFLSWTFLMQDAEGKLVGGIDRNFRGFGREIFTDTGQYVLRFDSIGETAMTDARLPDSKNNLGDGLELVESKGTRALTLDERAVALATAVSIDFDYFSRHSEGGVGGAGGGMFPWYYMGMGGMGGGQPPAEVPGDVGEGVPSNPNAGGDGGFNTGVGAGGISNGTDYPYGASESGMSEDGRLGQPPPSNVGEGYGEQPPQEEAPWWGGQRGEGEGEVWGTGSNDPWSGAGETQQQDEGFWGGWGGGGGGDSGAGGGGGWGGFFGDE